MMASTSNLRDAPSGILSGLLFFAVVLSGAGYIVFSKLHEFSALQVFENADESRYASENLHPMILR
jgi:hypothetical protein